MGDLEADLARVGRTGAAGAAWAFLVSPGTRAVMLYRAQESLRGAGRTHLAEIVSSLNALLTRAEILVGAEFGPGLVIRHPYGIVVGAGVRAGDDCTLLHRSTLGEKRADGGGAPVYPVLGDRVTVGVGATVLGGIRIGDDAHIGADALVLQDVPAGRVAVGRPARVLPRSWDE